MRWGWHWEKNYVPLATMDPLGGTILSHDVISSDVIILASDTLA